MCCCFCRQYLKVQIELKLFLINLSFRFFAIPKYCITIFEKLLLFSFKSYVCCQLKLNDIVFLQSFWIVLTPVTALMLIKNLGQHRYFGRFGLIIKSLAFTQKKLFFHHTEIYFSNQECSRNRLVWDRDRNRKIFPTKTETDTGKNTSSLAMKKAEEERL